MSQFIKAVDTLSEWSGRVVCWLVFVLTLMFGYEIVMRYVFRAPTRWAFDMSYMIGGSFFMLGQAYTLFHKGHVRIDMFYSRFSPLRKALVDTLFYLLFFFPLWIGLFYVLIPYVYLSWETGERSMQGYWMPILYPFKTVMPVAVLLFLLQGIADFIRGIITLLKGDGK
ncbi:MAG: TRAP transporter small permease subunit [Deltaproteobacteria bacterium]|nr:MAG: TRAP transporter small permease subunit [Deltaproteobacteria bacterium]